MTVAIQPLPDQTRTQLTLALRRMHAAVAAFAAAPTWAAWQQLRRRHHRYLMTHAPGPDAAEIAVLRSSWRAVCDGPFIVHGWTRESFVAAVNDLVAAGATIPLVHPDHPGARLHAVTVSGNGDCFAVRLADDRIGAIILDAEELLAWLYPVLTYAATRTANDTDEGAAA